MVSIFERPNRRERREKGRRRRRGRGREEEEKKKRREEEGEKFKKGQKGMETNLEYETMYIEYGFYDFWYRFYMESKDLIVLYGFLGIFMSPNVTPQNPGVPMTTVNLRKPVCLIS